MAGCSKDLNKLSDGERIWLWRQRNGLSQADVWKALGNSSDNPTRLRAFENGFDVKMPELNKSRPKGLHDQPSLTEQLRLARRRAGLGSRKTAKELGVSHVTLLVMEKAADSGLITFWRKKGFRGFTKRRETPTI